jgi:hypothetical protein
MEWHQVVATVRPYVFKVETPRASGTGFLFAYSVDKKLCHVATAAHVVEHADKWDEPIDVTHFQSGKTARLIPGPDRAVPVDKNLDTAAITFLKGDMDLPPNLLPLIAPDKHLKVGVELGWLGFPAVPLADLCFFSGRVSNWIGKSEFYFVDGVAINGVSGGPAFEYDENENSVKIVGIISAYIPNRATGEVLPGLLVVRDVTHLHSVIQATRSIEEAAQKKAELKKSSSEQGERTQ